MTNHEALVKLLERDQRFKIISNHNNKIELISKIPNDSIKSILINNIDATITIKHIPKSHFIPSPLSVSIHFLNDHLTIKSGQDTLKKTLIQEITSKNSLDRNAKMFNSVYIEKKTHNQIRKHFKLRTVPQSSEQWEQLLHLIGEWEEILKKLLSSQVKSSFQAINPKKQKFHHERLASKTAHSLIKKNFPESHEIPNCFKLIVMRTEKYEYSGTKLLVNPIVGVFKQIKWIWKRNDPDTNIKPVLLKAIGSLRPIDDSPPFNLIIKLKDDDLTICGSSEHIIKELQEKKHNLEKLRQLKHFGGHVFINKLPNRTICVEMIHGLCEHDIEIAYSVIQDIGWTVEMAWYSDRLFRTKNSEDL